MTTALGPAEEEEEGVPCAKAAIEAKDDPLDGRGCMLAPVASCNLLGAFRFNWLPAEEEARRGGGCEEGLVGGDDMVDREV